MKGAMVAGRSTGRAAVVRLLVVLLLAGPVLAGASGCAVWGIEGGPGGAGHAAPADTAPAPGSAVAGPDGVQRVEITLTDELHLRPSLVMAHPGRFEFTFRNIGVTPHHVRLTLPTSPAPGPGADTGNLNGGAVAVIRFAIAQPGTYPFPCLYHAGNGMVGSLVVRG
jgi:plastocyanin